MIEQDNRENVIKGLEQFIADFKPFCGNKSDWQRVDDAIALLKEQEPVEPTIGCDADGQCRNWWYQCGKCKEAVCYHDKYCKACGRKVKWE